MSFLKSNRRTLLKNSGSLLALAAFCKLNAEENSQKPNFLLQPKAKRVIFLTFSGGPSQLDLYDYKPELKKWHGKELPDSIRNGQRLTTMTSNQGHLSIAASQYKFLKNKNSDVALSELLPHLNSVSQELCLINSLHTEEINHAPAICYLNTGSSRPGKPSIGSWLSYGLGSLNNNLPTYVTMVSKTGLSNQSINSRLWNSGFLPSQYQATQFYGRKDPILFLKNPIGVSQEERLEQIRLIKDLNKIKYEKSHNEEILARSHNYELASKMQSSIPELTDFSKEAESTFEIYGKESKIPGTFSYNCLLARRLLERDVRFVQLFHRGWDHHFNLNTRITESSKSVDQASAALIKDLKRTGLLKDTLIVCSSEFGRTPYSQGHIESNAYGRDHHGRCFSAWLAGAGVKKGITYGESDEFSYNVAEKGVSVEELNATILKIAGIDHSKFSYFHNGLEERLTGIEPVKAVQDILS